MSAETLVLRTILSRHDKVWADARSGKLTYAKAREMLDVIEAELQAWRPRPAETVALSAISHDGPHKPGEHRVWLARQLLDSRLTEDEAYSTVAHSPAISDFHPAPIKPSGDTGELRERAYELANRLHKGCLYMRDSNTNCVVDADKTDKLLTEAADAILDLIQKD